MSFTGNLEDLAIVDVIQLLHSAKKSGTLTVRAGRRESQLVFDSGYIISANHPDESFQIGKILIEMKALTAEDLDQALVWQNNAGAERKPLIGTLIESGLIDKRKAFRGLEFLIEMTVVEMVTWTRGTFTLDVDNISVSDEYRYFPETLRQEMSLDTQMVLMDALRIFDEKKRDGEIVEQIFEEDESPVAAADQVAPPVPANRATVEQAAAGPDLSEQPPMLSAEDLGLADLDRLEARIPEVFTGLKAFDPADIHRQVLAQTAADLALEQREELAQLLTEYSTSISIEEASSRHRQPRAVLLYSEDGLLRHALMTVCKHEGVMVFVPNTPEMLLDRVEQSLAKGIMPMTILDLPVAGSGSFSAGQLAGLRRQHRQRYPQLKLIQLIRPDDQRASGEAYQDGAHGVFARPTTEGPPATFSAEMRQFLESLLEYVVACFNEAGQQLFSRLNAASIGLLQHQDAPAVAFCLLRFAAGQFRRCLTLVVTRSDLVAERGLGLSGMPGEVSEPLKFRLPLDCPSVFRRSIGTGEVFYGPCDDNLLQDRLFARIGAPARSNILLVPLQSRGRTISLTYADFGPDEPLPVVPEAFEILARQAGLVLENALYRKQLAASAG